MLSMIQLQQYIASTCGDPPKLEYQRTVSSLIAAVTCHSNKQHVSSHSPCVICQAETLRPLVAAQPLDEYGNYTDLCALLSPHARQALYGLLLNRVRYRCSSAALHLDLADVPVSQPCNLIVWFKTLQQH